MLLIPEGLAKQFSCPLKAFNCGIGYYIFREFYNPEIAYLKETVLEEDTPDGIKGEKANLI